jgi:hypothetical protein
MQQAGCVKAYDSAYDSDGFDAGLKKKWGITMLAHNLEIHSIFLVENAFSLALLRVQR